ncbi:dTDP-4-dehydrorhamnose 3,5-epimerase [Thermopolyspora flexuosa]|uniref:dTDP-4-dehydrorhamnose 3,5-epimerase n=1 Tax=Thermopolyspora flexuosa TaxID=103836 RepID=A0A543J394_9ACTN|nr:dTDP-4-dehydrorhamnose 3,5-epimerase [Thermopolyspora flexuosa]TQM77301.1 dTDP-4-dehydrorhamnose 3,5-epimerase [Thermopolyspora flexuosa]GGM74444.1 dTDP-4-dehydrorhamnose 3,5-epimerase [Thermopolyspora flexuosa]
MRVERTPLEGVLLFVPTPHHDDRGLFTRTFDTALAEKLGLEPFVQDSQSRSRRGVIRGMHGRTGRGEAKLVRCARGAVYDVVVDARPDSPTFGQRFSVVLDDEKFLSLYVPPGMLHGFQALSEEADVCYRIDRPHDPAEDVTVRYDDPELAIPWPLPVTVVSERDRTAGSWAELRARLVGEPYPAG